MARAEGYIQQDISLIKLCISVILTAVGEHVMSPLREALNINCLN